MTLIDTEVAAYLLKVTPRRVQQLVAQGTLHDHGDGRRIRLDLTEVSRMAGRK